MTDWRRETRDDYEQKGFAVRSGYGQKPALLIVDFINGFTDPSTPLGGDLTNEIAVTRDLLTAFRLGGLPVVYTTTAYDADYRDAGVFIKKVPSLSILRRGSHMVEIDDRLRPQPGEYVVEKKFASAFFGTDAAAYLTAHGVDTVIVTGCTTSGCVRASALDSMQSGYLTIVVREAVGDRAEEPHEANLFDLDAKYCDVVSAGEALGYIRQVAGAGLGGAANESFQRWWNERPKVEA